MNEQSLDDIDGSYRCNYYYHRPDFLDVLLLHQIVSKFLYREF